MGTFRLSVLGGFTLTSPEGREIQLSTRKDRLLLAYLALQDGRPQPRERLAGLFWAERAEAQARDSLRQSLAVVRSGLRQAGLEVLKSDRETVTLDVAEIDIDALAFEHFAKRTERAADAVALYRGALLDGIDPPTDEFAQWLQPERQKFEETASRLVERIAIADPSGTAADAAVHLCRQLLTRDQLREPVYRALMRLLAVRDRAEAHKVFAACRENLASELGIEPDNETEQLYRDVLTSRPAAPASPDEPVSQPTRSGTVIAVMPFASLGDNPGLDHLCEGLAEDITTGLGRFRTLFVIDRHSSLAVSRLDIDTAEIGRRLGATLLVQGSIQRLAGGLRITVRLVTAPTRALAWSDAFDCPLTEVLAIPERITAAIIATLHTRAESTIIEHSRHKPSLAAYECLLRGVRHLRSYGPDDNKRALELFREAITLDPDYALAKAYLAFANVVDNEYDASPKEVLETARRTAEEAVTAEPEDGRAHWLLGMICASCGDFAAQERHYMRAIALNPNDANVKASYGLLLASTGRAEEGVDLIREAMRLNPFHPEWYWVDLGAALYAARRYQDAIEAYRQRTNPLPWVLAHVAACHAQLGQMDEAAKLVAEVMRRNPDFRTSTMRSGGWSTPDLVHIVEGMRKAGLPD